jgi:hypothetical protein
MCRRLREAWVLWHAAELLVLCLCVAALGRGTGLSLAILRVCNPGLSSYQSLYIGRDMGAREVAMTCFLFVNRT